MGEFSRPGVGLTIGRTSDRTLFERETKVSSSDLRSDPRPAPHRIQIEPQFHRVIGTGRGQWGRADGFARRFRPLWPPFNPLKPPARLLIRSIGTRAPRQPSRVRSSRSASKLRPKDALPSVPRAGISRATVSGKTHRRGPPIFSSFSLLWLQLSL